MHEQANANMSYNRRIGNKITIPLTMNIFGKLHMYITAGPDFMTVYQHCCHHVNSVTPLSNLLILTWKYF